MQLNRTLIILVASATALLTGCTPLKAIFDDEFAGVFDSDWEIQTIGATNPQPHVIGHPKSLHLKLGDQFTIQRSWTGATLKLSDRTLSRAEWSTYRPDEVIPLKVYEYPGSRSYSRYMLCNDNVTIDGCRHVIKLLTRSTPDIETTSKSVLVIYDDYERGVHDCENQLMQTGFAHAWL